MNVANLERTSGSSGTKARVYRIPEFLSGILLLVGILFGVYVWSAASRWIDGNPLASSESTGGVVRPERNRTSEGIRIRRMVSPVGVLPITYTIPAGSPALRLVLDADSCAIPQLRPTLRLLNRQGAVVDTYVLACRLASEKLIELSPGELPPLEPITIPLQSSKGSSIATLVSKATLTFPVVLHSHPRIVSASYQYGAVGSGAATTWQGLRRDEKARICDACILDVSSVTDSEAQQLMKSQWKTIAPDGKVGEAFTELTLREAEDAYAKASREERKLYSNRKRLSSGKPVTLVASRVPFAANLLYLPSLWNTKFAAAHPTLPFTIQRALNEPPTSMQLLPGQPLRIELRGGEIIRLKSLVKAELLFEEEGDNKPTLLASGTVKNRMQVVPDLRVVRRTLKVWPVLASNEWSITVNQPKDRSVALRLDMVQAPYESILNPSFGSLNSLLSAEENSDDVEEQRKSETPLEFALRRPAPIPLTIASTHRDGRVSEQTIDCIFDAKPEAVYSVFGAGRQRLPVTHCKPVYWQPDLDVVSVRFLAKQTSDGIDGVAPPVIAVRLGNYLPPRGRRLPQLVGSHLDAWRWLSPKALRNHSLTKSGDASEASNYPREAKALYIFRKPLVEEFEEHGESAKKFAADAAELRRLQSESVEPVNLATSRNVFRSLTRSVQNSGDMLLPQTGGVQITAARWVEIDLPKDISSQLPIDTYLFLPQLGSYRASLRTSSGAMIPIPGSRYTTLGQLLNSTDTTVDHIEGAGSIFARFPAGFSVPKRSGWRSTQRERVFSLADSLSFTVHKRSKSGEKVRIWLYADPTLEATPKISATISNGDGTPLTHSSQVESSWTLDGFSSPFNELPAIASAACAMAACSEAYTVKALSFKLGEDIPAGSYRIAVASSVSNVVYARMVHEYAAD
jgi:hypothetical protein